MTRILFICKNEEERQLVFDQFTKELSKEEYIAYNPYIFHIKKLGKVTFEIAGSVSLKNIESLIKLINEKALQGKPDRIICSTTLVPEIGMKLQKELTEFVLVETYNPQTSFLQFIRKEPDPQNENKEIEPKPPVPLKG